MQLTKTISWNVLLVLISALADAKPLPAELIDPGRSSDPGVRFPFLTDLVDLQFFSPRLLRFTVVEHDIVATTQMRS